MHCQFMLTNVETAALQRRLPCLGGCELFLPNTVFIQKKRSRTFCAGAQLFIFSFCTPRAGIRLRGETH